MKLAGLLEQRETQEFLRFITALATELKEADLVVDSGEFARVWKEKEVRWHGNKDDGRVRRRGLERSLFAGVCTVVTEEGP